MGTLTLIVTQISDPFLRTISSTIDPDCVRFVKQYLKDYIHHCVCNYRHAKKNVK
jgi:hypothetical protein